MHNINQQNTRTHSWLVLKSTCHVLEDNKGSLQKTHMFDFVACWLIVAVVIVSWYVCSLAEYWIHLEMFVIINWYVCSLAELLVSISIYNWLLIVFRSRDWSHLIHLELLCYFVVCMRSELRCAIYAKFRAVPLNPIFRPRAPEPYFSALGPFKRGRGRVSMPLFFGGHWTFDVEMVKPLYKRFHILGDAQHFGRFFCRPFGENTFSKRAPKPNIKPTTVISWKLYGFGDHTKIGRCLEHPLEMSVWGSFGRPSGEKYVLGKTHPK